MTEQTKIPLPGERETSLFERASGHFGLDPFQAAPVPRHLIPPPAPRLRTTGPAIAPVDTPGEHETLTTPGSAVHVDDADKPVALDGPSLEVSPEPIRASDEKAVPFGGPIHPIDRARLRAQGLIVPEHGSTALLEEFRIIKRQLIATAQASGDASGRRILICSPLPGDGKTFCATNLAITMAGERDGEVLLVDADFAKPSILDTLGLPTAPGLMDALSDPSLNVEDLVMATDIAGLFVLPAGNATTADSEWLSSSRTADVLDRLTRGAERRMVVFDSPPALAASPAADLARHVGQAVLVARADTTGRTALEDAIHLLGACPDIKLLLNGTHFSPSGRRFGTYYGYAEDQS